MTRGKFVLITEDQVHISIEFNGDMYPSGYGIEVMNRLKKVYTSDDFISGVTEFNKENFQYKDKLIYIVDDKLSRKVNVDKQIVDISKYKNEVNWSNEISFDELMGKTSFAVSDLSKELTILEMKGLVEKASEGGYVRCI